MIISQIERLRKDYRELEHYEYKMAKMGRSDLVRKLRLKRDFLGKSISDMEDLGFTNN